MSTNFGNDPEFDGTIRKSSAGRSFSLIRVLVALGIIAILIALLLPANRGSRSAARRAQCVNNLKQIALALRNYEETHHALPPAYTVDANGRPLHSWRTLILPYLEQHALYHSIDLAKPWNDPSNATALRTPVHEYHCPEARGPENGTTYLAIVAANGCFLPNEPRRLSEITDAHSCTLSVIETGEKNSVPWMAPVDADESLVMSLGPTSKLHHNGGMNACLLDGSVSFLKASTPDKVRRALISISGNDDDIARER